MPVRPLHEAKPIFEEHKDAIVELVNSAHGRVIEVAGSLLKSMSSRTRQGLIRDLIVENLREWSERTPGVQYQKNGNLEWFGFANNWILRVKHVDADFGVEVSPTRDSQKYNKNEMPTSISAQLIDEEPATALYLGWYTTQNSPIIPEVCLVCPNEHAEIAWVWPFSGEGPAPTLHLPVPEAPQGSPAGVRITVKASKSDRKKSG